MDEPGADLAVALAVASAARGVALGDGGKPLAAFGELGLTGELRHAAHPDRRLAEAAKFGLDGVLAPGERLCRTSARLSVRLLATPRAGPTRRLRGERPGAPQGTPGRARLAHFGPNCRLQSRKRDVSGAFAVQSPPCLTLGMTSQSLRLAKNPGW